MERMGYLNWK